MADLAKQQIVVHVTKERIWGESVPNPPHPDAKRAVDVFSGNGMKETLEELHAGGEGDYGAILPHLLWLLRTRLRVTQEETGYLLDVRVQRT